MFSIAIAIGVAALAAPQDPLIFDRQLISTRTYEAASAFDVNKDGNLDIVSGEFWYEGPDFTKEHRIGAVPIVGEYYDDFSNYPLDVNNDGWTDIVTGGYFGCVLRWRENPGTKNIEWPMHDVGKTGNIERNTFFDMNGDGVVEVMPVTKPVYIFRRDPAQPTGFSSIAIDNGKGGHGFGCGDVNGDGRPDVIVPLGWLEAPQDMNDVKGWVWHEEFNLGSASVPVLVYDVNQDGKNDLVVGEAHNFGLYWMEQGGVPEARTWTKHVVESIRSQYHDLQLHDIDNDGQLELVTGKRYRAHNGHDPGDWDPLGLYYFKMNKGSFERVTIDYGDAQHHSGAGIYFWVTDVNKDGWLDVVAPGKQGLYLFKNRGR